MPSQALLTWLARHPHFTADAIAAGLVAGTHYHEEEWQ